MLFFRTSVQQISSVGKSVRTVPTVIGLLVMLFLVPCFPESSRGKDFDLVAIGVRGGLNFQNAGLPPGEKEHFQQYDVFGIMSLPWSWDFPSSGWELHSRLKGSAGALRAKGDTAFITTITPGLAFRKPSWGLIFDAGVGVAAISDWEFGQQDVGGPFQFIAHGGVSYELPWNLVAGYRFHHMSDATIYGNSRGVDLHMFELSYYFGE